MMLGDFAAYWIFFSVIMWFFTGSCECKSISNDYENDYENDYDPNVDPCWDYEPTK